MKILGLHTVQKMDCMTCFIESHIFNQNVLDLDIMCNVQIGASTFVITENKAILHFVEKKY